MKQVLHILRSAFALALACCALALQAQPASSVVTADGKMYVPATNVTQLQPGEVVYFDKKCEWQGVDFMHQQNVCTWSGGVRGVEGGVEQFAAGQEIGKLELKLERIAALIGSVLMVIIMFLMHRGKFFHSNLLTIPAVVLATSAFFGFFTHSATIFGVVALLCIPPFVVAFGSNLKVYRLFGTIYLLCMGVVFFT